MNTLLITLFTAAIGHAHILGNDTITHFSMLSIQPDRLELDFVLDIGETPAMIVFDNEIDSDHDHHDSTAEQEAWVARKAGELAPLLQATFDNQTIKLEPADLIIDPMTGQTMGVGRIIAKTPSLAGTWTYKVVIRYEGVYPHPAGTTTHTLRYTDTSFPDHPGLIRVFLERTSRQFRLQDSEELWSELQAGPIPPSLRELFQQKRMILADDASLTSEPGIPGWLLSSDRRRFSIEQVNSTLFVALLPKAIISPPRPLFWDECPISPFIYEQYDLTNLPQLRSATIQFHLTGAPPVDPEPPTTQAVLSTHTDPASTYLNALNDPRNDPAKQGKYRRDASRLIELLQEPWGLTLFASVTLLCFGWGAAHALMPGHAKTLVAAYLISQKGTWQHAVCLAIIVTVTHTALVVLLGLTLWIYQSSNPTLGLKLQLWLGILAGLLVAAMGLTLAWRAVTGQIGHHHHTHNDRNNHSWLKKLLTHSHLHPLESTHTHMHEHAHEHHHPHEHHHQWDHDAKPLTIRLLLMLGITGGMVPCPTAAIIMLLGIGANVILGALYAIAVFSLGLALTLMVVGFLALGSRRFAAKLVSGTNHENALSGWGHRLMLQAIPAVSGVVVLTLGCAITAHYIHYLRTGLALFGWIR